MAKTKHVIWSNLDLDLDDWRDDLLEEYPHINADDDDALYRLMVDTNNDYLDDERCNLNIQLSQPILVIADLGLWHGRRMGSRRSNPATSAIACTTRTSTLSGTLTATATCAASLSTTTVGTTTCSGRGRMGPPIPNGRTWRISSIVALQPHRTSAA